MVQVLARGPKKPSFLNRLMEGGLALGGSILDENQRMKSISDENSQLKNMTGLDFSGVSDPKVRQEAFKQVMMGQQRERLENLKNENLKGLYNDVLGGEGLLNASSPQEQQMAQIRSSQEQPEMQGPRGPQMPKLIPEDKIAKIALINPAVARELRAQNDAAMTQFRHQEDQKFKRETEERQEAFALVKPILQQNDEVRKNIPLQEQAINEIMESSSDVGMRDYLADVYEFEPLRSSEGVRLKTAIKDFFLSDLSRAGARPNQWIEQQLADALPKIGRSAHANQITGAGLKFKVDLAKKRIEIIDELAEKDRERHGHVRPDIDSRASKQMAKYVADRQRELSQQIKDIKKTKDSKPESKVVRVRSPDGIEYDIHPDDLEEAEANEYIRV